MGFGYAVLGFTFHRAPTMEEKTKHKRAVRSDSQALHTAALTRVANNLLEIHALIRRGEIDEASSKLWDNICKLEREVKRSVKGVK